MSQQTQDRQAAGVVTVATILASTLPPALMAAALAQALGITVQAAAGLLSITPPVQAAAAGPATAAVQAASGTYRAAYLSAAAGRVKTRMAAGKTLAQALKAEAPLAVAHLRAQRNRVRAAAQVDGQVTAHGPLLGWYAVMDGRTSAECAAANGRNFSVTSWPVIGLPGSVHPHCRCRAGAPHVNAGTVDRAVRAVSGERRAA